MLLISKSLEERRANPYRMSEEDRALLFAMTEAEIEAAALAYNPPWIDAELKQAVRKRDARLAAAKRSA